MNTESRAVQVWFRLVASSVKGATMTYGDVASQTGASAQGLGSCLRPIQRYCESRGLPLLSAIVVSSHTRTPGTGFGSIDDIQNQQDLVFRHDWLRTRVPEPEDLAPFLDSVSEQGAVNH